VTRVSGHAVAVAEFTAGRPVWHRRRIASQESVVLVGALGDAERLRARTLHLNLEPLTLQQVVVHAAGAPEASSQLRTSA
jgi:ABC-2 type transport system ATP-binding protein